MNTAKMNRAAIDTDDELFKKRVNAVFTLTVDTQLSWTVRWREVSQSKDLLHLSWQSSHSTKNPLAVCWGEPGLKRKCTMQCMFTVQCQEETLMQRLFPTSAAKWAFKSSDRHTSLYNPQGNVTQSNAYVDVKLAAIISLNIHEIFLSVVHTKKENLFKLHENDNYFPKECVFN